jgi:hypothetical protein
MLENDIQLFSIQRRACIAFFTAATFTFIEISDELHFNYIIADQYVINYYHLLNLGKVKPGRGLDFYEFFPGLNEITGT